MVVMMKWSPWTPAPATKNFQVKIKEMKLEGFFDDGVDEREKVMVVEVRWKGIPKPGLVPFHRKGRKHVSTETVVRKGEPIMWDDEFENACSCPVGPKDHALGPRVSFTLLHGAMGENKLGVIGKTSLNLAEEMTSKMNASIEAKLRIHFDVAGVVGEATLSVCLSFVEVRDSNDSPGIVLNSTESKNVDVARGNELEVSWVDSDESAVFDSEGTSENESVAMTKRVDASESRPSPETQSDSVKKAGLFSWKRRRLSFKPVKAKAEPLIKKTSSEDDVDPHPKSDVQEESTINAHWEEKELISRDGQAKLNASVFFASFDQRSDKAEGESACTALVTVIAHWLQSNLAKTPTRSEFDKLIIKGSSEWRNLCDDEDLISRFPNKHFDLETVLRAGPQPTVSVLTEKSFVGFFSPEKFESLKGAMSFDEIWDKIKSEASKNPNVYVVSWNDHFFVLRVDADAYYVIDTLGERLYEGCDRAYILRFDDHTLMHGKVERGGASSEERNKLEEANEEVICRGKECCREFIKRFLAAIPLGELESAEGKEPVPYFDLHQRLQIEFNFTSLSLSSFSSSTATSSSSSLSFGSPRS